LYFVVATMFTVN